MAVKLSFGTQCKLNEECGKTDSSVTGAKGEKLASERSLGTNGWTDIEKGTRQQIKKGTWT